MDCVNPTLVLMPGMDGTGDLFAPLLSALGSSVETVVVKYPDVPANYAAHEAFARVQLPRDRPYVLLGESFSGPIAISIAATAPDFLVGCILCASFATCPRSFLSLLRPLLPWLPAQRLPNALAERFLMGRFATRELRKAHVKAMRRVSPKALAARLQAIASVDVADKLARVRIPCLYMRATEDRLVPAAAGVEFMRRAPRAQIVEIKGPHFLLQASASQSAREIQAFMRDLDSRDAPDE